MGRWPDPLTEALKPAITEQRFSRGAVLSVEGERAQTVRLLKTGSAFVLRRGLDDRERPIAMASRGAPLGALGFFGERNLTSAVAVGAVRCCDLPLDRLAELGQHYPELARQMATRASESAGYLVHWAEALRLPGIVNQLGYCLLLMARAQDSQVLDLPTHSALAQLLGTRRETIVRALANLQAAGCIDSLGPRRLRLDGQRMLERIRGLGQPAPDGAEPGAAPGPNP